jgi:hypothetical protein
MNSQHLYSNRSYRQRELEIQMVLVLVVITVVFIVSWLPLDVSQPTMLFFTHIAG